MAVQQFTNIGTFSSDGVWTTAANWPTGGVPGDSDEVVVQNTSYDITTVSGQGGVDLDRLSFDSSCTHKVGASGDRLTIDVMGTGVGGTGPGHIVYEGTGSEAWFTTDTILFVANAPTFGTNACVVKSQTVDIDEVLILNGRVTLDGGTYLTVTLAASQNTSSICQIDDGSTLTTVNVSGGTCACSATDTITTLNISGGEFQHLANEAITTMNLYDGIMRFDGAETITTVNQFGGMFDWSRTAANKVVTTYNGYGGILDLRHSGIPSFGTLNIYGPVKVLGAEWLRTG